MKPNELTNRRRFLAGAGKYGALLAGAAYLPGSPALETVSAQLGDSDNRPVQEKSGAVKILGLSQRRAGLTRRETAAGDSPHTVGPYYGRVYRDITKKQPGRTMHTFVNVVTDAAFGGDRSGMAGLSAPNNLHIDVADPQFPSTTLANRDMECELEFDAPAAAPGRGGAPQAPQTFPQTAQRAGFSPNMPRWMEPGTQVNLIVQQLFAQGTRPDPGGGGAKGMYFLKMSPSVAAANQLQTWQALHASALEGMTAFSAGVQGFEVLQRLPDAPARQAIQGAAEIALPDIVASFWLKTANDVKNFSSYARRFRGADKENALDLPASFFLLIEEYEFSP